LRVRPLIRSTYQGTEAKRKASISGSPSQAPSSATSSNQQPLLPTNSSFLRLRATFSYHQQSQQRNKRVSSVKCRPHLRPHPIPPSAKVKRAILASPSADSLASPNIVSSNLLQPTASFAARTSRRSLLPNARFQDLDP